LGSEFRPETIVVVAAVMGVDKYAVTDIVGVGVEDSWLLLLILELFVVAALPVGVGLVEGMEGLAGELGEGFAVGWEFDDEFDDESKGCGFDDEFDDEFEGCGFDDEFEDGGFCEDWPFAEAGVEASFPFPFPFPCPPFPFPLPSGLPGFRFSNIIIVVL